MAGSRSCDEDRAIGGGCVAAAPSRLTESAASNGGAFLLAGDAGDADRWALLTVVDDSDWLATWLGVAARRSAGSPSDTNGMAARARMATMFGHPNRTNSNVICVLYSSSGRDPIQAK